MRVRVSPNQRLGGNHELQKTLVNAVRRVRGSGVKDRYAGA